MQTLIGPFSQLLPFSDLSLRGALFDERLEVISNAGVVVQGPVNGGGIIIAVGSYVDLKKNYPQASLREVPASTVCLPGLIDAHTHLCWAGSRAVDFAMRNAGATYVDIGLAGGGIKTTVKHTRAASSASLQKLIESRLQQLRVQGITTVECKSGYGLSVSEELRHLEIIDRASQAFAKTTGGIDVIKTCLAAHVCPAEFSGDTSAYLSMLAADLFPRLQELKDSYLRIDAFAEPSTFWGESLEQYLRAAKKAGFPLTLHADQFTPGGAALACKLGALSADHLEASDAESIAVLAKADTVAVALPGASIGLGEPLTPARKLLDAGASVAIASDWNPGSAPQGQLLAQATLLAAAEKLTNAELWAGLTFRAAQALGLSDRGRLVEGMRADFSWWPTNDYREISWLMGSMHPLIP